MAKDTRTIKIYERTHPPLRLLAAMTGETMMDLLDRLVQEEKRKREMKSQLKVNYDIERSVGNRYEIRFWLSAEVDGRTHESRGTVVTVEKKTTQEARQWMRRIGYEVAGQIFNRQWTAANANEANKALSQWVDDAIADDNGKAQL